MSDRQGIIDTILDYVADSDRYAMMVTGEWGCGKTWLIENDVREALSNNEWNLTRVSLYGVATSEELNARIVAARAREIMPKNQDVYKKQKSERLESPNGRFIDMMLKNVQDAIKGKTGVSINLTTGMLASALTWSKTVLVLDDLERRAPDSDNILFGQINDLVEGRGVKIVFLCNDKKDKSVVNAFDKIIWRRVRYTPSMEEQVDNILEHLDDSFPNSLDIRSRLLSAFAATQCHNIRELWKLRRMLQALCACSFTTDAGIPTYARGAMLEDVLRLCLEYSSQRIGNKASQPKVPKDADQKSMSRRVPSIKSQLLRDASRSHHRSSRLSPRPVNWHQVRVRH